MTGVWEQRLINLAQGGVPWDAPTRESLIAQLDQLRETMNRVATEPGFDGAAGRAARAKLAGAAAGIVDQTDYLARLEPTLAAANAARQAAHERLSALPAGGMEGWQEAAVRGATVGSTIVLGPLSFVAAEGAVGLINGYLSGQREEAAQTAVREVSAQLDGVDVEPAPPYTPRRIGDEEPLPPPPPPRKDETGGGGGGGGRPRSFESYPDFDVSPTPQLPEGSVFPTPNTGIDRPDLHTLPGEATLPPIERGPIQGGMPIVDIGHPTADGSTGGIGTMPAPGSLPGGNGIGVPGGSGTGLGSGLSAGLVAGAGGAAALNRLGGAAAPGAAPASARGVTGTGGLLGKGGVAGGGAGGAGAGLGVRGGGVGGAGGSVGTGQSAARGAGMRAGLSPAGTGTGMAPGGANTSGRAASNGSTAAGAGSRGVGAGAAGGRGIGGMGGGTGARDDRKDQARGLGGPIAPRLDDDEEIGPRSENAGSGARDDD